MQRPGIWELTHRSAFAPVIVVMQTPPARGPDAQLLEHLRLPPHTQLGDVYLERPVAFTTAPQLRGLFNLDTVSRIIEEFRALPGGGSIRERLTGAGVDYPRVCVGAFGRPASVVALRDFIDSFQQDGFGEELEAATEAADAPARLCMPFEDGFMVLKFGVHNLNRALSALMALAKHAQLLGFAGGVDYDTSIFVPHVPLLRHHVSEAAPRPCFDARRLADCADHAAAATHLASILTMGYGNLGELERQPIILEGLRLVYRFVGADGKMRYQYYPLVGGADA